MKFRSSIITYIIFIGISSAFGFALFFLQGLKKFPVENESQKTEHIKLIENIGVVQDSIGANGSGDDTVELKDVVNHISIDNKANNNELKNDLTLNLSPKTLIFITYQSMYLSGSILCMCLIILFTKRLFKEFKFNLRSKEFSRPILEILILLILTFCIFYFLNGPSRLLGGAKIMERFGIVFNDPINVVKVITITASITALVPLFAIAIVNVITSISSNQKISDEEKKGKLSKLKDYLNTIAFLSGLILAGTIIGLSLQRSMIGEYLTNISLIFPDEFIGTYGVSFSFVLAVFFVPTLLHIKVCERDLNLDNNSSDKSSSWLRIGKNTAKELELAFSIFLPLFASVFQHFLI